ncbi:MAG: 23S rRNA (adenine(2503)-C(2))-methyltransferase RlmN [Proteobacteria bacterium]|nr:23S rRNA (adenine(2503)-C(2))-methyltransferase RlmN [Pseudomonadota bacterium]MCP4921885.1 23S rRNA (adenine(2503)-C(2))-methyltransferase RlmN [Pseudomonadota bacterium]
MARPQTIDGKIDIKSLSLSELTELLVEQGHPKFRARQVYKWVWNKGVTSFHDMTNVSKTARKQLDEAFVIDFLEPAMQLDSADGTKKFVWELRDESHIESVLIPDPGIPGHSKPRMTLCMSSQVGCAMACSFCLTGDLGFKRNLRVAEILNQALQVQQSLPEGERITNLVFMGMGEPLHNITNLIRSLEVLLDESALNFSHRKITVSTVGLVPQMARLAAATPVNLAVSLNATTNESRSQVMPITRRYPLSQLMDGCRDFPLPHAKRITFEYVMMAGFNDSWDDAARLVKLMSGVKSKVNLIPYNENPQREILRPSEDHVKAFQHFLVKRGVQTSIRTTRGIDISAACGQLGKATQGMRIEEAGIEGPTISLD